MKARHEKFVMSTAFDVNMARILDEAGIDIIGTSASPMNLGGKPSPVSARLGEALYHVGLVAPGTARAIVECGMTFGSYQVSNEQAVRNAIRAVQAGADTVKLQGAGVIAERVHAIHSAGVLVCGHIGLTPQYVTKLGGFRSVGRRSDEAVQLYEDAKVLEQAGAWCIELECVPYRVAEVISRSLTSVTVGVGSGAGCDGQVLAVHDILGLQRSIRPKLAKTYVDVWDIAVGALRTFGAEVRGGTFPRPENTFEIDEGEFNRFLDRVGPAS